MSNFISLDILEGKPIDAEENTTYKTIDSSTQSRLLWRQPNIEVVRKDGFVVVTAYMLIEDNNNFKKDKFILLKKTYRYSESTIMNNSYNSAHDFLVAKGGELHSILSRENACRRSLSGFPMQGHNLLRVISLKDYKNLTK